MSIEPTAMTTSTTLENSPAQVVGQSETRSPASAPMIASTMKKAVSTSSRPLIVLPESRPATDAATAVARARPTASSKSTNVPRESLHRAPPLGCGR